jgi:hypothetical protein
MVITALSLGPLALFAVVVWTLSVVGLIIITVGEFHASAAQNADDQTVGDVALLPASGDTRVATEERRRGRTRTGDWGSVRTHDPQAEQR